MQKDTLKTEVVIIGAGPGGSSNAIFLAQKGIKSVMIEKDPFPRFHIGESMTGECGETVRQLGLGDAIKETRCTVKHKTIVYGQEGKNNFTIPVMRRNEAGELEKSTTWQVRRSDFDKMLLDKAKEVGVQFVHGKATKVLFKDDGSPCGVEVRREDGSLVDVVGEVVVDASGQATFLSNEGVASKKERGKYSRQLAIYSHVKNAKRGEEDNTLIFYEKENHWAWFIPIDEETVSVGVVTPSDYYRSSGEDMREFYLREMKKINPELTKRIPDISLVEDVRATSNYSYHIHSFTGKGFLCVGDAHRFIDPIFSFGLQFALVEGRMAAEAIADYLHEGIGRDQENPFAAYEARCEQGMDTIQDALDCFWANPFSFAFFVHSRYVEDFIDIFAGRVYQDEPSPGLQAVRKVNAKMSQPVAV
ncbi:NAD(P)/FAD-dependent oxidoreductase [Candidatus Leptofilum sp.]|uniref:NAD(P)/FAD-dependent oxidoreductase n=1 Tax=Candidatus Leptofilum sp. TaxID=3241576 RepID=UPI003B5AB16A